MSFWELLRGSDEERTDTPRALLPLLLDCYREEVRLTKQIRAHAERSPHEAGARQLGAAAEEQDRFIQLLQDRIITSGGEAPEEDAPIKTGRNHWERVVHDLEDSQELARQYKAHGRYWAASSPEIGTLFTVLERGKIALVARLRDIALRADTHALD